MRIFLTLNDQNGISKIAAIELPDTTHVCPGMNLIVKCNDQQLRVPVHGVDIKTDDGSTVVRIDSQFQSKDKLLSAPEMEWVTASQ